MNTPEYTIVVAPQAEKECGNLDKADQKMALKAMQEMQFDGVKRAARIKYSSQPVWRRRKGDIRIIFYFDAQKKYIKVISIKRRDDLTYKDLEQLISRI